MKRERMWMLLALLWLGISVLSMFVGIVRYTDANGVSKTYAIQDMIDGEDFSHEVLSNYTGEFQVKIGAWALPVLCALAVGALAAALIGILILSKQRSTLWPFVMTIVGIVATAIPALAILAAVALSSRYFVGTIAPGFYPIVAPAANALCICIVAQERRRVKKAQRAITKNENIYVAGDL